MFWRGWIASDSLRCERLLEVWDVLCSGGGSSGGRFGINLHHRFGVLCQAGWVRGRQPSLLLTSVNGNMKLHEFIKAFFSTCRSSTDPIWYCWSLCRSAPLPCCWSKLPMARWDKVERWGGVVSLGVLRNGDPAEKQNGAEGCGGFSGSAPLLLGL